MAFQRNQPFLPYLRSAEPSEAGTPANRRTASKLSRPRPTQGKMTASATDRENRQLADGPFIGTLNAQKASLPKPCRSCYR